MSAILDLLIMGFVVLSGCVLIALLVRILFRPKPARRLLTLVIEERETKGSTPPA